MMTRPQKTSPSLLGFLMEETCNFMDVPGLKVQLLEYPTLKIL